MRIIHWVIVAALASTGAAEGQGSDRRQRPADVIVDTPRAFAPPLPRCKAPPVPANARLIVYGGYEGDAISSAVVGGPDEETNLIEVKIEPGAAPLYLVLTSYESVIWRVSGASHRVVHAVVASQASTQARPEEGEGVSLAGVVGLSAHKVTIMPGRCLPYFDEVESREAGDARQAVMRATGRTPDLMVASYSASLVTMPSGGIAQVVRDAAPVPRGFDPAMWRDAIRFWPGGLVRVDPRRVVAAAPVTSYSVLPSQMGLAQLIGSGAVRRAPRGVFRIVRPIAHLPPSMGGAHSVTLALAKGVPLPPGDPVHSCILSEATGEPVRAGARCR